MGLGNLNRLRSLGDYVSPVSWFIQSLVVMSAILFFMKPSLLEIGEFLVIDFMVLFLLRPVERGVFFALYPETKVFFFELSPSWFVSLSFEQQCSVFKSFLRFPLRRATFIALASFIKGIPALLVIVFLWKHLVTDLQQFFLGFVTMCLSFSYFYGALYLESHRFLSENLEEAARLGDLRRLFYEVQLDGSSWEVLAREYMVLEILLMVFLVLFTLGLQVVQVLVHPGTSLFQTAINQVLIGLIGLALFLRLWFLDRRIFMTGLEQVHGSIQATDYRSAFKTLTLSTVPILARFNQSYNQLGVRLKRSEQELSLLIREQADRSRFRAIGEVSALIAHDLSGPLHAVQFCAGELSGEVSSLRAKDLVDRLARNTVRAIELVNSLRAKLKVTENSNASTASFSDAHRQATEFLKLQFTEEVFNKVRFEIDKSLERAEIKMSSVDLIHVLDNVYRDSIVHFLDKAIPDPSIAVEDAPEVQGIRIFDNGHGLPVHLFEEMTSFRFGSTNATAIQVGLGLRLTRRLLETYGGDLRVKDIKRAGSNSGTCFEISNIKKAEMDSPKAGIQK